MSDNRNMYGCLPCPDCKSVYRFPLNGNAPKLPDGAGRFRTVIMCDDCGRCAQARQVDDNFNEGVLLAKGTP